MNYDSILMVSQQEYSKIDVSGLLVKGIKATVDFDNVCVACIEGVNDIVFTSQFIQAKYTNFKMKAIVSTIKKINKNINIIYISETKNVLFDDFMSNDVGVYCILNSVEKKQVNKICELINNAKEISESNLDKFTKDDESEILNFIEELSKKKTMNEIMLELNMNVEMIPKFINIYNNNKNYIQELLEDNKKLDIHKRVYETFFNKQFSLIEDKNKSLNNLTNKYNECVRKLNVANQQLNDLSDITKKMIDGGIYNIDSRLYATHDTNSYSKEGSKKISIIYIKELIHTNYLTSLCKYLNLRLNKSLRSISKLLIIENQFSIHKANLYPQEAIIQSKWDISNFINTDYYINFGNPKDVFSYICQNDLDLDYLIVLDRSATSNVFLVGDNVIHYYAGHTTKQMIDLGYMNSNILVNLESDINLEEKKKTKKMLVLDKIKGYNSIDEDVAYSLYISNECCSSLTEIAIFLKNQLNFGE